MINTNSIPTEWWQQTGEQQQQSTFTVVKVLNPMSGSPAWGSDKGTRIPRESGLECQEDLIIGFQRTEGNKDYSLEGHKQNFSHTKAQRRGAVTPQKIEPKLPASV